MSQSRRARGEWGERRAEKWYTDAGYEVLDRNWRTRAGELDLVLARNDEIIFCEVKARASDHFGTASEAVNYKKQRRIRSLAAEWLNNHDIHGRVRFDVAAVTGTQVQIIEAAF